MNLTASYLRPLNPVWEVLHTSLKSAIFFLVNSIILLFVKNVGKAEIGMIDFSTLVYKLKALKAFSNRLMNFLVLKNSMEIISLHVKVIFAWERRQSLWKESKYQKHLQ